MEGAGEFCPLGSDSAVRHVTIEHAWACCFEGKLTNKTCQWAPKVLELVRKAGISFGCLHFDLRQLPSRLPCGKIHTRTFQGCQVPKMIHTRPLMYTWTKSAGAEHRKDSAL